MSFGHAFVGKNNLRVELDAIAAAQVAAYNYGLYDVDIRDNDKGNYTIVASREGFELTVRGKTLDEAVQKLIDRLGETS